MLSIWACSEGGPECLVTFIQARAASQGNQVNFAMVLAAQLEGAAQW